MKIKSKLKKIIDHLMLFVPTSTKPTEDEILDFAKFYSQGGNINKDNPLYNAQKWEEWTLAELISEMFEWWIDNMGWQIPLLHELQKCEIVDPVMYKKISTIKETIETKYNNDFLEFYMKHPSTNKNMDFLEKKFDIKFN